MLLGFFLLDFTYKSQLLSTLYSFTRKTFLVNLLLLVHFGYGKRNANRNKSIADIESVKRKICDKPNGGMKCRNR